MSDDGVQRIVRASRIYDAQEVERRDGPRYVRAVRGAKRMRANALRALNIRQNKAGLLGPGVIFGTGAKRPGEREFGSPVGWFHR